MTSRPRIATPADASAIARVHVACWHETYPGMMPRGLIASHSVSDRTAGWTRMLSDPASFSDQRVFVAGKGAAVAGFGACVRQRVEAFRADFEGEIAALYVREAAQMSGVGTALMRAMAAEMTRRGYHSYSLWVLRDNDTARRFYERRGGRAIGERQDQREGLILEEIAYGSSLSAST